MVKSKALMGNNSEISTGIPIGRAKKRLKRHIEDYLNRIYSRQRKFTCKGECVELILKHQFLYTRKI